MLFKKKQKADDATAALDAPDVELNADGTAAVEPKKKGKVKRIILIVLAVILVSAIGVLIWLFYIGALAPWYAAAKYDGMHYITEQEVEDYISAYQKQQGYEDCTDEEWAIYLAYYGLTPETLRQSTIQQLVTTAMVEKAAKQNDVEITDEEWEVYATNIKNNLAFGDDEVYQETIEAQGQTVEEFEEAYRLMLLRERLYEAVVEVPDAEEEDAMDYLASYYYEETTTKHIYYFELDGFGEDGDLSYIQEVQEILNEFKENGVSVENFEVMVGTYSEDEDLIETGGAYGWDLDISDYSDEFQEAVENTEVGEVSDVFDDTDGYAFVYIDTDYTIPAYDADDPYEFSDLPDSLQGYFLDCAALELWADDCEDYLLSLYENSGCIVYAMPEDVSYNVDMDLATEYAEEQMEEEDSSDDSGDEDDADEDESEDDSSSDDSSGEDASTEEEESSE